MTAADLARIAEAIDADQRTTDVSNWPLSRERTRGYIRLALAALALEDESLTNQDLAIMALADYDAALAALAE